MKQYGTIDLCLDDSPAAASVRGFSASPLSVCGKSPPRSTPPRIAAQPLVATSAACASLSGINFARPVQSSVATGAASAALSDGNYLMAAQPAAAVAATSWSGVNRSLMPAFDSSMHCPPQFHGYGAISSELRVDGSGAAVVSDLRDFKWGCCPKHHSPLFVHTYASGPKRGIPHLSLGDREPRARKQHAGHSGEMNRGIWDNMFERGSVQS